ncbi:MAG: AEC family transporter [Eubacteriales bacterium]|nr:AEC family transporter [Eubacteriales bacterium]
MSDLLSNLLFSINVVLPLVLITVLGFVLKQIGMVNDNFISVATRYTFCIAFPCNIYRNLIGQPLSEAFDIELIVFLVAAITLSLVLPLLIVPRFVKDRAIAASMIQSMFRPNFLIQGTSLLANMYGEGTYASCAIVLPFIISLNNILATVDFVVLVPENNKEGNPILQSALKLLKNPLILSCAVGLLFCGMGWRFPYAVENAISNVGATANPLALLALGADFRPNNLKNNLRYSLPTVLVRLIVIPGIIVPIAVLFGFRGIELAGIYVFTGSGAAAAGYIMSKNMGGNEHIAAETVCLSTGLSAFSLTFGIFLLRSMGLA